MSESTIISYALITAREQLITLGGDPRGDQYGDKIQAAVLELIDEAIAELLVSS